MRRPSPSMIVAFMALLISLGGTAFAAKQLITSSGQVKNGVLTGADIKDGSLGAKEISSAGRASIRGSGSGGSPIKGDKGAQGVAGAKGDQGPKGDSGPPGADGQATTALTVYRSNFTIPKAVSGTNVIALTMTNAPPGSYLFTSVQQLQNTGAKSTGYSCALVPSTGGRTESAALTLGTDGAGGVAQGSITEQVTATSTDPITVRLACTPDAGATLDATVLSASIVAIRLQSETATAVTG